MKLAEQTDRYRLQLGNFIRKKDLPVHWFELQDHVAIKAYSPDDYERLLEQFMPLSSQVSEVWVNERRIAAAKLLGKYSLDMQLSYSLAPSTVGWLELMEARPADQKDGPPRLDHEEIYFPNGLIPIRAVFRRKKIPYLDERNPSHEWVSVLINEQADELKFTDRQLSDIVSADLESGRATIIKSS